MIHDDKQMEALIRKIQKEVNNNIKKKKKNVNHLEEVQVDEPSAEIFNEMKKRPYTS